MPERTPSVPASVPSSGPPRRSTRIARSLALIVTREEAERGTIVEATSTISINCHGCSYLSQERPRKGSSIEIQLSSTPLNEASPAQSYAARIAWARKSPRLSGMYLIGAEFATPQNLWQIEGAPEDWSVFSPADTGASDSLFEEVRQRIDAARTATYYQILGAERGCSRGELKHRFYAMARRFHPDYHTAHPQWTPKLIELMGLITAAYRTLSDDDARSKYDASLQERQERDVELTRMPRTALECLESARACLAERNYAGSILWMRRAIEFEPNSSDYRAILGRCLAFVPEYRGEAVQQFEMALELDEGNLSAHLFYADLLEQMRLPWRARVHYARVLDLDPRNKTAQERLNRLDSLHPRSHSRSSLLARFTGRR